MTKKRLLRPIQSFFVQTIRSLAKEKKKTIEKLYFSEGDTFSLFPYNLSTGYVYACL